uniref:DNA mismatch repair protein n=1 Tax=Plectus sambesii TaxID=2011161 RepID=A0A914XGZ6_9BILA
MSAKKGLKQSSLMAFMQKTSNKSTVKNDDDDPKLKKEENGESGRKEIASKQLEEKKTPARGKTFKKDDHDSSVSPNENRLATSTIEAQSVKRKSRAIDSKQRNATKRRRVIVSDSEEESDGEDVEALPTGDVEDAEMVEVEGKGDGEVMTSTPARTKLGGKRVGKTAGTTTPGTPAGTPRISEMSRSFLASFRATEEVSTLCNDSNVSMNASQLSMNASQLSMVDDSAGRFAHLDMDFLQPNNIRDAQKRRPTDPEYDPRTLYIPEAFFNKQSPGHQQWWRLKTTLFDTVLLFKIGKFYELYHMDAVVGVTQLNLNYMKGAYAHCGFPEIAYGTFSDQLVQRGYKVARVEQTETPEQMAARGTKGKAEKVVRRELCAITTIGTRTFGVLDGNGGAAAAMLDSLSSAPKYLLAIAECMYGKQQEQLSTYGICFVDTAVGKFYLGQFDDDMNRSYLRTAIAHHQPAQILIERGKMSKVTTSVLKTMAGSVMKEALTSKTEFLTAEKTLEQLANSSLLGLPTEENAKWPKALLDMLAPDDPLKMTPAPKFAKCLSALGAIVWYLKRCLIDVDLITMRNFEQYIPPSQEVRTAVMLSTPVVDKWRNKLLVLDGITLSNLNIVPCDRNYDRASAKISLLSTLDYCSTAFGKRLLRQWVCAPLCDPTPIRHRQDAIEALMDVDVKQFIDKATTVLKSLPDLERLLQKIHTLGLKYRSTTHPDGRAVMFEAEKYSKRKINDLCSAIAGFQKVYDLARTFQKEASLSEKSLLLKNCFGEQFPDIADDLTHFQTSFDHAKAKKEGVIVPERGLDDEYDDICDKIVSCEKDLEDYLKQQRKKLDCNKVCYFGNGKNRYQLEVPDALERKMGHEYDFKSSRKGFKRYSTAEIDKMFKALTNVEAERDVSLRDVMRRVFADFDKRYSKWSSIVERVGTFDVLLSLTKYALTCGLHVCRPEFIDSPDHQPLIEIRAGKHPGLASGGKLFNRDYIANDTNLGGEHGDILLLTGPNMGGKSTLMRQISLLVVMAQMGAFVPAEMCKLTPVDRIFTRLGANDRIGAGQSTFYVELNETNVILRDATRDSLVIIDELGRGTATHDGTAIAFAVLKDLSDRLRCRSLFSTHYHSLVGNFIETPNVKLGHMACMVENENESDPTEEVVTFLYKLVDGACPKSYGFYAAKLAGIHLEVVRNAYNRSKQLDQMSSCVVQQQLARLKAAAADDRVTVAELAAMVAAL